MKINNLCFLSIIYLLSTQSLLLYSQEPDNTASQKMERYSFSKEKLDKLFKESISLSKEKKHKEYTAYTIFKGIMVDEKIYTGINIYINFVYIHIQYYNDGIWYRDKWLLNDKNKTVVADGFIQGDESWKGTFILDSDLDIPFKTVATFVEGKRIGKVTTYDSNFKTIIAEGIIKPKKNKEGSFFYNIAFGGGIGPITTFSNNIIQKKIWFDLENKTILTIGTYKNGKPFNGYFIEFNEMKKDDFPPIRHMVVYHSKNGKLVEKLSAKEYLTKYKNKLTAKIELKPFKAPK